MTLPVTSSGPTPALWSRLDGIAVVNLDDRPDRWTQVQADAAPYLVGAPPLTRISAVRGTSLDGYGKRPWFRGKPSDKRWAAKVGCTQSHRRVMEFARAEGWDTFLVLEDDADFRPLAAIDLAALEKLLFNTHRDWDVCYLGFSKAVGTSLELTAIGAHRLCALAGCYTTHAYLVKAQARDWIIDRLAPDAKAWSWHSRHRIIDRWYSRQLSRALTVFAVSPSPISQIAGFSDIVQRQVDYASEFAGHLQHVTCDVNVFRRRLAWRSRLQPVRDAWDAFRGLGKRVFGF